MKLNFRIYLKPDADFQLDAEPSDTIRDLKVKINASHGYDIETQNVLFCADNLEDDKTLESCGISEKGFLVLTISEAEPPLPVPAEIGVIEYYDHPERYEFDISTLDITFDPTDEDASEVPSEPTAFDLELISSLGTLPPIGSGFPFKYKPLMPSSTSTSAPAPETPSASDGNPLTTPAPTSEVPSVSDGNPSTATAPTSETPSASDGDLPTTPPPRFQHVPISPSIPDPDTTSTTPVPPVTTAPTFKYRPLHSSPLASAPDAGSASDAVSQSTYNYKPLSATPSTSTPDTGSTSNAASQSTFKYRPLYSSTLASAPDTGSASDAVSQSTYKYKPLSATPSTSTPDTGSTSNAASQSTFKYRPLYSSTLASAPDTGSASDAASQSTFKYRPLSSSSSSTPFTTTSTARPQQGSALGAGMPSAGGSGLSNTTQPNVRMAELRQLVTQSPEMRQFFVQQLAQENPELGRLLTQNPDLLMQLLDSMGQDSGTSSTGDAAPGVQALRVTETEREAIERLEALGFPKQAVIEAYFACDKNEQLAANYLLENA